jgi:hypothetical protein
MGKYYFPKVTLHKQKFFKLYVNISTSHNLLVITNKLWEFLLCKEDGLKFQKGIEAIGGLSSEQRQACGFFKAINGYHMSYYKFGDIKHLVHVPLYKTPISISGSGPLVLCFGEGRGPHRSLDVQL